MSSPGTTARAPIVFVDIVGTEERGCLRNEVSAFNTPEADAVSEVWWGNRFVVRLGCGWVAQIRFLLHWSSKHWAISQEDNSMATLSIRSD